MFITTEILYERGACQEYLDFFGKHFPNGVEMKYAIERAHLPYHALHWGYENLDPNEEEVRAYWDKVCVVDSQGVHESDHITGSYLVSESSNVTNSQDVYNSKDIVNSSDIAHCESVEGSEIIANSSFVDSSSYVLNSQNVVGSTKVVESNYVMNSYGVTDSDNVVESQGVWRSKNLTKCGFCADCSDLSNALFCTQVSGEYMLFNKKVDQLRFEMTYKQFRKYLTDFLVFTNNWDTTMGKLPTKLTDWRKHFDNVPASFWTWTKTLPGYDPFVLYQITYNSQFL